MIVVWEKELLIIVWVKGLLGGLPLKVVGWSRLKKTVVCGQRRLTKRWEVEDGCLFLLCG
jgi:hypothetical protein